MDKILLERACKYPFSHRLKFFRDYVLTLVVNQNYHSKAVKVDLVGGKQVTKDKNRTFILTHKLGLYVKNKQTKNNRKGRTNIFQRNLICF